MPPEARNDSCELVAETARKLLNPGVTIRLARTHDLALLVEIERAAGETFRSHGMDLVADDDPGSVEELTPHADEGRAYVAVDTDDRPVGYLLVDRVDGDAHIEQVSVHPDHARQGVGRALIDRAARWAHARGLAGSPPRHTSRCPGTAPTTSGLASATSPTRRKRPACAPSASGSERKASTHGHAPACAAGSHPANAG